jgi:hypothetical protein
MSNPDSVSSAPAAQPAAAPESSFTENLKGLGYCLFALVGGLVLLGWQWNSRAGASATLQWPTAEGKIVSSEVEQKEVYRRKRIRTVFDPQIQYSYEVDGKAYTGHRIDYYEDQASENEQTAIAVSSKYPAGEDVKVYYNPQDPASSLLEPGVTGSNATWSWAMIGLGGFLTLIGLFGSIGSGYSLMAPARAADA